MTKNISKLLASMGLVCVTTLSSMQIAAQVQLLPQDNYIVDHAVKIDNSFSPNAGIIFSPQSIYSNYVSGGGASVLASGNIAISGVSHSVNGTLAVVSPSGGIVSSSGECGGSQIGDVLGLPDGNIVVSCFGSNGIVLLNSNLLQTATLVPAGSGVGQTGGNPYLTQSDTGALYALDIGYAKIISFSETGGFLNAWPLQATLSTELLGIAAIGNNVFVLRGYNSNYSELAIDKYTSSGGFVSETITSLFEGSCSPFACLSGFLGVHGRFFFAYSARPDLLSASPFFDLGYVVGIDGNINGFLTQPTAAIAGADVPVPQLSKFAGTLGNQLVGVGNDTQTNQGVLLFFDGTYRTASSLFRGPPPLPSVLSVSPQAGSTVVNVVYEVFSETAGNVTTSSLAFLSGTLDLAHAVPMFTFVNGTSGNIGANIPTGAQETISWNAGADLSGQGSFQPAAIYVMANDGRGLIDVHLITIPANVPSSAQSALTISDTPIRQSDMLWAWFWLVATKDSSIVFSNGQVTAASGGQLLASGTTTTAAGVAFLLNKLGVRQATSAEIARAVSGSTNTPAPGNQYVPLKRVGNNPLTVNEIGFDTGAAQASSCSDYTTTCVWVAM